MDNRPPAWRVAWQISSRGRSAVVGRAWCWPTRRNPARAAARTGTLFNAIEFRVKKRQHRRMRVTFNRRHFLGATAVAAASFAGKSATEPEGWFSRPMRWAQLTLVEDDPGKYDPAFWLDYFQRTHSDAACLSAGGCVAYYPTEVPLHYRSQWLGTRDAFGELAAGCRKLGMVVVARTDPH